MSTEITARVMVAMPCYGGKCYVVCMKQVMRLQEVLRENKIEMELFTLESESLISRARNVCATVFLKSQCTHLLFIDSDIVFDPESVLKMIKHDKMVMAGMYPMKSINFEALKNNIHKFETLQQALQFTGKRVGNVESFTDGIAKMKEAPTGFMLIQRQAFDIILEKCQSLSYRNDIAGYEQYTINNRFYDFFQVGVHDDRYLSEDYGFCALLSKCSIERYSDPSIRFIHIGNFFYF